MLKGGKEDWAEVGAEDLVEEWLGDGVLRLRLTGRLTTAPFQGRQEILD